MVEQAQEDQSRDGRMEATLTSEYVTLANGSQALKVEMFFPDLSNGIERTAVPVIRTADGNQSQDS